MDIWICGYVDMWICGYVDIWIYGWINTMVGSSWVGEGCCPPPQIPPTRIFMRGSAPQTPHRFNGYTPPHLDSNVPMDICMDISMYIHGYVRVLAQGGGLVEVHVDTYLPTATWAQASRANPFSFRLTTTKGVQCCVRKTHCTASPLHRYKPGDRPDLPVRRVSRCG